MGKEDENKDDIISQLVEVASEPLLNAKQYWKESIYNVIKVKKESIDNDKEYADYLKSELIYFRKLWNSEVDAIYSWGKEGKIPEALEINNIIVYIESQAETCVENGKIKLKNGKNLDKDDLIFIERYTSIPDLEHRIIALEEDYLYFRIRDYITLNIYQFLSQNQELGEKLLKNDTKETIQRIANLVSNFADICMYDTEHDN